MRVGCAVLVLALVAIACGDDDSSALRDGGFSRRDAAIDQCVPYYLASGPCMSELDSGMAADASIEPDAGMSTDGRVNLTDLSCELSTGSADTECDDISWDFACGEHLNLVGCCAVRVPDGGTQDPDGGAQGTCGVIDPTGVLGCIDRQVFGASAASCTPDLGMDAGSDEDASADDDASASAT